MVGDLVKFVGHRTDDPILGLIMAIDDVSEGYGELIVRVLWITPPAQGRLNIAMVPDELEVVSRAGRER